MQRIIRLARSKCGATAIEYALIAVLIAVAAVGAMQLLGGRVSSTYTNVSGRMG